MQGLNKIDVFITILNAGNYAELTKKAYVSRVKEYLSSCPWQYDKATNEHLASYISKQPSEACMKQTYAALKLFYKYVMKRENLFGFIPYPKTHPTIPDLLPHSEMLRLCNSPLNLKHRLILNFLYGTGMRNFELCKARWCDIERTDEPVNPLTIKITGKGQVQRRVPLSKNLYDLLIRYCKEYKLHCNNSDDFIFGKPYSKRSVAVVCRKIGLTPHQFRHQYAQWLVDNGTELETVRQLLGHKSLRTVEIYARTKPGKIKTPV